MANPRIKKSAFAGATSANTPAPASCYPGGCTTIALLVSQQATQLPHLYILPAPSGLSKITTPGGCPKP